MDIRKTLFYARINKIEFNDFRNIEHGEVEFPNSSSEDFLAGNPSVVGLYGQNGSGKSSVIMALGILKDVLSGKPLSEKYMSCIRYGCDRCSLTFSFSMYSKVINNNGESVLNDEDNACYNVFYSFDIAYRNEEIDSPSTDFAPVKKKVLTIENEALKYRFVGQGKTIVPKQTFIDTSSVVSGKKMRSVFGSKQKEEVYSGFDEEIARQYYELLAVSKAKSQSFIFSLKTISLLEKTYDGILQKEEINKSVSTILSAMDSAESREEYADRFGELVETSDDVMAFTFFLSVSAIPIYLVKNLRLFGTTYLHVIDTVTTGLTNINTQLPLLLWGQVPNGGVFNYRISLQMDGPTHVSEKTFPYVERSLRRVSGVLEKIVPGVKLVFTDLGKTLSADNEEEHYFDISSCRGNTIIPLKFESDGIRRIVSILSLLIAAYNDASFTVAIDEIDSGIFEYLLGELFSVMVESVKGQLIFTSHNLRPLEVMPSKYLCFTTTDPEKRFTKIASRGNSNLRDTYFRSIVLGTRKDSVYESTDKYEIALAFYKAGHDDVGGDL